MLQQRINGRKGLAGRNAKAVQIRQSGWSRIVITHYREGVVGFAELFDHVGQTKAETDNAYFHVKPLLLKSDDAWLTCDRARLLII